MGMHNLPLQCRIKNPRLSQIRGKQHIARRSTGIAKYLSEVQSRLEKYVRGNIYVVRNVIFPDTRLIDSGSIFFENREKPRMNHSCSIRLAHENRGFIRSCTLSEFNQVSLVAKARPCRTALTTSRPPRVVPGHECELHRHHGSCHVRSTSSRMNSVLFEDTFSADDNNSFCHDNPSFNVMAYR